jgi:hypothetical protein
VNAVEPDQKRARFGCGCNFCGMQTGDLDPGAPVPSDTAEASIQIQMSNGTDKYCFTILLLFFAPMFSIQDLQGLRWPCCTVLEFRSCSFVAEHAFATKPEMLGLRLPLP